MEVGDVVCTLIDGEIKRIYRVIKPVLPKKIEL